MPSKESFVAIEETVHPKSYFNLIVMWLLIAYSTEVLIVFTPYRMKIPRRSCQT